MRNGERRFSEKELSCVCPRYHCFNPYMNETPRRYVPGAARLPRRSSLRERASSLLKTRPCALFIFQQTFFTPGQRPTPNCFEKFVQRKETPASARQAEPACIYSHPAQRSSLFFSFTRLCKYQIPPLPWLASKIAAAMLWSNKADELTIYARTDFIESFL